MVEREKKENLLTQEPDWVAASRAAQWYLAEATAAAASRFAEQANGAPGRGAPPHPGPTGPPAAVGRGPEGNKKRKRNVNKYFGQNLEGIRNQVVYEIN